MSYHIMTKVPWHIYDMDIFYIMAAPLCIWLTWASVNTVSPIIIPITLSPSPIKTLLDISTEWKSSTIGKSVSNSKKGSSTGDGIGEGDGDTSTSGDGDGDGIAWISGEEEDKKENEEGKKEKDGETNQIRTKVNRS